MWREARSWAVSGDKEFVLRGKWWTDCCDQLFPGFKSPRLWVAQHCRSSTPPPTSRRGRHIDALFLDSRWGGNKCSLRGRKSVDHNRPPICRPLCKNYRTEPPKGRADWRLAAQYRNCFCSIFGFVHYLGVIVISGQVIGSLFFAIRLIWH